MSLTSFLDLKDVKVKFRQTFSKPSFDPCQQLLAPPLSKNYSLVGTAFDYLLRFYLERTCPFAIKNRWVAELALRKIRKETSAYIIAEKIIFDAKENLAEYLQNGHLVSELLRSCLLLAQLDPVVRRDVLPPDLGQINELDVQDLRNLLFAVPEKAFTPEHVCLLNPTFGIGSNLVGGADIDLVIDDTLIEIKTTKKPMLQREHFNQILGYYILCLLSGIDGAPDKHKINKLGIYFSRYGRFFTFPVHEVSSEKDFEDFTTWFVFRAEQNFGISIDKLRKFRSRYC